MDKKLLKEKLFFQKYHVELSTLKLIGAVCLASALDFGFWIMVFSAI